MSLNRIRSGIVNRAARIKTMRMNFEDERRVQEYRDVSLRILKADYLKEIEAMQTADKVRQLQIIESYRAREAPPQKRAESLSLLQNEIRASSVNQLKAKAEHLRSLPPVVLDVDELYAISAELRNRGASDDADNLSNWVESNRIDAPWTWDPTYRSLDTRIEKLNVYAAQCEGGTMMVLSDDPEHIAEQDIIMIEKLDTLPEAES
jgi:hypothetical protein